MFGRIVEKTGKVWSFNEAPFSVADLEKYYKWDKFIWVAFLALRRFDCRVKTKLLRQRYEFILPGDIKR
jgi:hypothetical protein